MSRMSDLEVVILQTNKYEYCKYFCSLWNYVISSSLFTVINGTEFVFFCLCSSFSLHCLLDCSIVQLQKVALH